MSALASVTTMRCKDPKAAVDWLCEAFGFERHLVADDGKGGVAHAQLTFGKCMVMLGPIGDGAHDALVCQPDQAGGRVTQAPYIVVDDPEAHCQLARAAGAEILLEPKAEDYGGINYTCRDPEGHVWNFGSYNPWTDNG